MKKLLFYLFSLLIFFVPLVLWPFTSEVFEFNKMVLVYILTVLICSTWLVRIILTRSIIFRRTILDIPLLVFLGSQLISTLLSIDPSTSLLGYYSRFNGGLLSTLCYSLLYWAFVSNFDSIDTKKLISYSLIPSAILVSVYGVLEHFGIDKNIWVQDVQSRVFSTLGQPNWLAAYLVALMPITWAFTLERESIRAGVLKLTLFYSSTLLLFLTLLFTGSRSGLLGFAVADVIFWSLSFLKFKKEILKSFLIINSSFLIICLIVGTQFTPSINELISKSANKQIETNVAAGPALETGGTESGTIRKIVWQGAIDIWKNYPIFGSGVETFAYAYPKFRPVEHNLVSEWDFIYNKAHNEYLNLLANTGAVGLITYLVLVGFSIYVFEKNKNYALLAGYVSLLVTNFFGFSVVPTQLLLFLFPAMAIAIAENSTEYLVQSKNSQKIENIQKILIFFVLCTMFYVLLAISKYWYSDTLYTIAKANDSVNKQSTAIDILKKVIEMEPNQSLYYNELASSYAGAAIQSYQQKDATGAAQLANLAISESQKAIDLSPNNPNLKRSRFGIFIMLYSLNPNYLILARDTLVDAINYAPTDAKLYYNLALTLARTKNSEAAIKVLQKTIELKSNYKEARLAYAFLLIDKGQKAEAKVQLEYILKNIDPKDEMTKQTLESIK